MHLSKRPFVFLLVLTLTAGIGCSGENNGSDGVPAASAVVPSTSAERQPVQPLDDPPPVPDVMLETMDGESIALTERSGEVLLVNFWATWCAPCREEIPDLVALQEELGPQGLTVIGVSVDQEGASIVEPFLNQYAVNYPIVLNPEGTLEQSFGGVYGLPMTFVVGPEGRIQYRILGRFPADEMRPKLTALLKQHPPSEAS